MIDVQIHEKIVGKNRKNTVFDIEIFDLQSMLG